MFRCKCRRGPEQARLGVDDQLDRHGGHHSFEPALGAEPAGKTRLQQGVLDPQAKPARDHYAAAALGQCNVARDRTEREAEPVNRGGGQVDLQIPIFDTGEARTRTAREAYMRALNLLAGQAVDARSEARVAYETYRATYDIARSWRDRVLPLRQRVSKEIMLRYTTGVLAGEGLRVDLFKYLTDTRVRIAANAASLDARRDFLLAAIDLQAVLTIGGETASKSASTAKTTSIDMQ